MVPVKDLATIARARVADREAWRAAFAKAGREGVFIYTRETVKPEHHVHARMFWPAAGVPEDPATGSAVAAFSGVAATCELPEDGTHQLIIEQGFEMGRPSRLNVTSRRTADGFRSRVGGGCVPMFRGEALL